MVLNDLLTWIKQQAPVIDEIIYNAAVNYYKNNCHLSNFKFDLNMCQKESFNLINGKDLCYDRPNTAFVYSLWYQARRLNTFIHSFAEEIFNCVDNEIEIFDLGAGTGAVQMATGLIVAGLKENGSNKIPQISIINIDSSQFMLDYNKDYLWPTFLQKYRTILGTSGISPKYSLNSWANKHSQVVTNSWITASYLFDVSDKITEAEMGFIRIIDDYKPSKIFLLSSKKKKTTLNDIANRIATLGYNKSDSFSKLLFSGNLKQVNNLRKRLDQKYNSFCIGKDASWQDFSFCGVILSRKQIQLNLSTAEPINLYNPKVKRRTEILLSKEQKKATEHRGAPSIIIGPAGSGKSIVISEKVFQIVKNRNYAPNLKILITSFNKKLIKKLGDWLEEMLDSDKFKRQKDKFKNDDATKFIFVGSNVANIRILHFDLLPTRIGNGTYRIRDESYHKTILRQKASSVITNSNLTEAQKIILLDSEFLMEEYHRVFYGLSVTKLDEYLKIRRVGMWKAIGKRQREEVYKVIIAYAKHISKYNIDSFTTVRRKFWKESKGAQFLDKFEYILVDEFQDCTQADFEIFFNLFSTSNYINNLTIAGDFAQSIHIGKSAANPPRHSDMKRRVRFFLNGSYRLPQRVSEAIIPLSERIAKRFKNKGEAPQIAPVKGSPPGARPIVVFADSMESILSKVGEIALKYCYSKNKQRKLITILERDRELSNKLNRIGVNSETSTILQLKGLEKSCILWSTRIPVVDPKETYEFVYTILTRTSSVLIIALSKDTNKKFKKVLSLLDREKLIFWDKETQNAYNSFCEIVELEIPEGGFEEDVA